MEGLGQEWVLDASFFSFPLVSVGRPAFGTCATRVICQNSPQLSLNLHSARGEQPSAIFARVKPDTQKLLCAFCM